MDELLTINCGMHPDDHVLYTLLSYNLSFPSLMSVTSLIMPTNNGVALRDFTFEISKLHLMSDVQQTISNLVVRHIIVYNSLLVLQKT